MSEESLSFSERRRRLLEAKGKAPSQKEEQTFDPEDIPDATTDWEVDDALEAAIDSITIDQAYTKWINKSPVDIRPGQTESIKVSCPNPSHPDKDPSAWINIDNHTWFCGGCQEGGDRYDLAAIHYGYPRPGYKEGENFRKLRTQMAEDFGYVVKKVAGGEVVYKADPEPTAQSKAEPSLEETPEKPSETEETEGLASVTELYPDDDEDDELVTYPSIDWRSFVPEDTFLRDYLEACSNDDAPEEYHFWHGLLALGHSAGRNVSLDDHKPVWGNLLLCLLGASGAGKSRSRGWLDHVLRTVLPFTDTGQGTSGVKLIPVPGSGEYLVKSFSYEAVDPTNPKHRWLEPVNGIVDFDELAALLARANRQGSTLKTTIMGLADARNEVSIGSLTHKEIVAERPYCSITATTQPRAVRALLNKTDAGSGFLNRWVFAGGPEKRREAIGGKRSAIGVDLSNSIAQLKKVKSWTATERLIEWEDDAADLVTEFFHDLIYPTQKQDDSDLLKRLDLLIKKLCLLFTVNQRQPKVQSESVQACIQMTEYLVDCYGLLEANIGITQNQEIIQLIMYHARQYTKKHGKGISVSEVVRATHRKKFAPDQVKKALETMVALDMVELEKPQPGKVGRPTIRYRVVGE